AAAKRSAGQNLRRAASRSLNDLQLAVSVKTKRAAVRRPEGIGRSFGASQHLCIPRADVVYPDSILVRGFRISDKRQGFSVGRKGYRSGGERHGAVEVQGGRTLSTAEPPSRSDTDQCQQEKSRRNPGQSTSWFWVAWEGLRGGV